MPLNREGIEQLKADLRANAQHYTQNRFGTITPECGTEACISGMCYVRKIGLPAFTNIVKDVNQESPTCTDVKFDAFIQDCLKAAAEQIGLTLLEEHEYEDIADDSDLCSDGLPPIFSSSDYWPEDLRDRYEDAEKAHDHTSMAELACEALDRIDENGVFIEA